MHTGARARNVPRQARCRARGRACELGDLHPPGVMIGSTRANCRTGGCNLTRRQRSATAPRFHRQIWARSCTHRYQTPVVQDAECSCGASDSFGSADECATASWRICAVDTPRPRSTARTCTAAAAAAAGRPSITQRNDTPCACQCCLLGYKRAIRETVLRADLDESPSFRWQGYPPQGQMPPPGSPEHMAMYPAYYTTEQLLNASAAAVPPRRRVESLAALAVETRHGP
jgi:hypothetical protein